MRRFYASPENFQPPNVELNLDESKHLREVLRLQTGEQAAVFDGTGREFLCQISETGARNRGAILQIVREIAAPSPESVLDLTLAAALLKSEKFDLVVQKSVELGVTRIIPILTKRCDFKFQDANNFSKKIERYRRIALEAAKQSGRAKLPEILDLTSFEEMISRSAGAKILFAENGGTNFSTIKPAKEMTAVIGSEGGWEESEIRNARENGFQIITLGGRILRAETAAISAAAILQHRFGDLS